MLASWHKLESEQQLENAINISFEKTVVFFKHSTRCGTSLHAKHKLETDWNKLKNEIEFYYLDLLEYRHISNKIAHDLNVIHQSPQIIVVKNGKSVYSTSHNAISVADLNKVI
jgi:bacillithiol system protein YtxJ